MTTTHISHKQCRPYKPHRCRVCYDIIERHELCDVSRSVEQGQGFSTMYFHPECWVYTHDWSEYDWEMNPGDISRAEVNADLAMN